MAKLEDTTTNTNISTIRQCCLLNATYLLTHIKTKNKEKEKEKIEGL